MLVFQFQRVTFPSTLSRALLSIFCHIMSLLNNLHLVHCFDFISMLLDQISRRVLLLGYFTLLVHLLSSLWPCLQTKVILKPCGWNNIRIVWCRASLMYIEYCVRFIRASFLPPLPNCFFLEPFLFLSCLPHYHHSSHLHHSVSFFPRSWNVCHALYKSTKIDGDFHFDVMSYINYICNKIYRNHCSCTHH